MSVRGASRGLLLWCCGITGAYLLIVGVGWALVALWTTSDIDGPISLMGRLYGASFGVLAALAGFLLAWFVYRSVTRSTATRATSLSAPGEREA